MKPLVHNNRFRMNVSCKMAAKMKRKLLYILGTYMNMYSKAPDPEVYTNQN